MNFKLYELNYELAHTLMEAGRFLLSYGEIVSLKQKVSLIYIIYFFLLISEINFNNLRICFYVPNFYLAFNK